jgi:uncharacterized protein (DUF1810 family)
LSLERFVEAQAGVYARALGELKAGKKQSHWMWFIFPQITGLGHSHMAQMYAIQDLVEAKAYLTHSLLGARLRECCRAVMAVEDKSAHAIFGSPDDLKFCSSLTLFAQAAPEDALFRDLLGKYYGGTEDERTLAQLSQQNQVLSD